MRPNTENATALMIAYRAVIHLGYTHQRLVRDPRFHFPLGSECGIYNRINASLRRHHEVTIRITEN